MTSLTMYSGRQVSESMVTVGSMSYRRQRACVASYVYGRGKLFDSRQFATWYTVEVSVSSRYCEIEQAF